MTTLDFVSHLNSLGIKLTLDGNQLSYRAPKGVMNQDLKKELLGRKTEIIAFLEEAKNAIPSNADPIVPVERSHNLPLSFAQERMWFVSQVESKIPYYNTNFGLHFQGALNIDALEWSLNEIIRRHESLRTTFPAVDGKPVQAIAKEFKIFMPIIDLQGFAAPEVQEVITQQVSQLFDLSNGPLLRATLLRLGSESHTLVLSMHHIIIDGWSMGIFFDELSTFYRTFTEGNLVSLPELPIQYADFAVWQRQWLTGEVLEKQLNYWKQQLAGATPAIEIPTDKPRPLVKSYRGDSKQFEIDRNLTEQLNSLSQKLGVTLYQILLATYVILLYRYSGQEDICVGCAIANRNSRALEPIVGFFANTLVLRNQIKGNPSFSEFLSGLRQVAMSAYAHQDVSFQQVVTALQPERSLSYHPLFQTMFVLENFSLDPFELADVTLTPQVVECGTAGSDLGLLIWETKNGLLGWWQYSSDLFEEDTIARMVDNFQTLLAAIVANPEQPIGELPLLTEKQQHRLLVEWNPNFSDVAVNQCIHELFEKQVQLQPNTVAVVWQDQKFTYQQLNAKANQLAHYLRKLGIGAEALVGICVERSPLMIIGLLGILKAGGAYVPINPDYPNERSRLILAETQVSVLLSQYHLAQHLPEHQAKVICLDSHWEVIAQQSEENLPHQATPANLAYIIYSSQRGVLVEHGGVSQRLSWLQKSFTLSESDVVLHKASLDQDTAVREIFWPLVVGSRLIIAAKNQDNPTDLQHLIVSQQVSVINFVPSALLALIDSLSGEKTVELRSLRLVLCSGEPFQKSVFEAFRGHCTAELHNLYSLPETAGEVTSLKVQSLGTQLTLPIGHPSYMSVYILDQYLQPVPIGVKGEIYVGGTNLARGYLNAEEETAQRFIKNPFQQTSDQRLFKTGELARRLHDGSLELLGSIDRQAWIKGYRLELSELETALLASPAVDDAWVLVRQTETVGPQLIAYVVLSGAFFPEQLQSHLQTLLPTHLLPSAYVPITALPLTPTGQVDEQALTRLEVIESDLVQRWEEQLQALPEIDQVAVVVQQQVTTLLPLHLSDLLGDHQLTTSNGSNKQVLTTAHPKNQSGSNKPAISYGEPLHLSKDAPTTLAQALHRAAKESSNKGIVYIQSDGSQRTQTYEDLLFEAQRILTGLRKLGLKPQDKVIFQLEENQDFIAAFWGCVLGGFVPVPMAIAPTYERGNTTTSKLENAWHMLGQPTILTTAKLAPAIRSWSEVLNLENFQVEVIDDLRRCEPDQNWHVSQPEDLAILLLTSGSTGIPKAVMQTHQALLSRSAATAIMNNFTSNDVSLNWLALDHVGGLVMFHIRDVYLGCQQIHAPTELVLANPLLWLDWIEQYRATITWAPNFAYGLINDKAQEISKRSWDLSSMGFILNGGEAIVAKHARKFLHLLAGHGLCATAMHPSWGMSETSSGVVFSHNFSLDSTTDDDSFVEVGAPIPGFQVRIVDTQEQIVTEETIGRVQVKGPCVTRGYYQNPKANQEAFSEDGWLNTGDLGFLYQGRLTITGRQKDVIIINGINYYSHEIESTVEELAGVEVSYTAAVAVRGAFDNTDKLAIFFSPVVADEANVVKLTQKIRSQVVEKIGINPDYLIPVEKQIIPKTAIGKIQRSQLKERFQAGEFKDILKQFDILKGNANTVPDWFYRKIWQCKEVARNSDRLQSGFNLVFCDRLGLGELISRKLKQPCICVEAGAKFAKLDSEGILRYSINPHQPDDYRLLLESLAAENLHIAQILHLWTYDEYTGEVSNLEALEQAQKQGIYSLLFLVQALAKIQGSEHAVKLQVISSHAQFTSSADKIAYEKSTLMGFLKTIPLELSWLQCRHIDLEVASVEVNAQHILRELRVASSDTEIAYRQNRRFVSSLGKVDMSQQPTQEIPLKQGGTYLVTGGLGGIGTYLCQYLMKEYSAKLIIVGRTEFPNRSEWSKYIDQETHLSKRIKNFQQIAAVGGEFIYQAIDICDFEGLQKIVAQAETQWNQPLSGIIHLAGEGNLEYHWKVIDDHYITVETLHTFDSMLRPKVHGTWTLYQLIKNRPQTVFISFSSINSIFGGASFSAYSAANSFLDTCSLYQRHHLHSQTYCLNWTMWDEVGMSQKNPAYARDAARSMGYHIISKEQGLTCLIAALYRNQTQLIVGLDSSNRNIRRYTQNEFQSIQRLTAYFTSKSYIDSLSEIVVRDRFNSKTICNFVRLEEMPLTAIGTIEREKLLTFTTQASQQPSKWVAPRTEIERQLASIWQQILSVPLISIHDNFFELGGHSLLATQLISRVQDVFQLELPLASLFENPTVAQLSTFIVQKLAEQTDDDILAQLEQLDEEQVKVMLAAVNT
ncbi:AMP-dependent synthetase and ligase [Nostoc sp. NIES-4103]|nr:AMP-dependent synthetase and ligase [Nostoc sp. NIES-4103]